jgi:RNA polymerase sigma-70 factor (ECF subfamily)
VLFVLYLIFNEGYSATTGDGLVRRELCAEAIRLGDVLVRLMPDEPEAIGLLALMLLQDARRDARLSADGQAVLLEDQDRGRWDRSAIDQGTALVERALRMGRPGPYQIQAAIAALHCEAARPEETDWPQIAILYAELARLHPTPVVKLNRAAAVAMADGPEHGLALMEPLGEDLDHYHLFHAARADLLRRLDRRTEAASAYRRALELASNDVERGFLRARLREMEP